MLVSLPTIAHWIVQTDALRQHGDIQSQYLVLSNLHLVSEPIKRHVPRIPLLALDAGCNHCTSHPPSSALNPHSSLSQLLSVEVMALPCPWLKSGSKLFPFLTEDPEKAVEYSYFPLYSKITVPGGDLSGNWVVIWAPICGEAGWGGFHCSFRTPQGQEYASMPYYHTFFFFGIKRHGDNSVNCLVVGSPCHSTCVPREQRWRMLVAEDRKNAILSCLLTLIVPTSGFWDLF